jgi:hypothetical protein
MKQLITKVGTGIGLFVLWVAVAVFAISFLRLFENMVWWLSDGREIGATAWVLFFGFCALCFTLWPLRKIRTPITVMHVDHMDSGKFTGKDSDVYLVSDQLAAKVREMEDAANKAVSKTAENRENVE